jgi:hypothetical protein
MADSLSVSLPAFPTFQRLLRQDNTQALAKFEQRPTVDKEIQYFKDKAPKLTSMDDLFKDQRLLRFIASAYSLDDEIQYPARLRKILESKISDPNSLANRMVDPRYKEMANDLMLGDLGVSVFDISSNVNKVVNRYVQNEYEKDLGKTNPALREASYFLRKIGNIKDSLSILGDGVLRNVVTYTLDLPPQIAFQSIAKQQSLIDARIDVKKFINGSSSDSTSTHTVDQANADMPVIDSGLKLASAAATQVQTVISRLNALKDDYARVANVQNPSGPFASEIPVQQAAAPELTRMSGMLAAAQSGLDQIAPALQRMADIITASRDPANAGNLTDYKSEFADLKSQVDAAVAGANYMYDDNDPDSAGTAQNLLNGTQPATITVQTTAAGDTVSIRGQNLSGLLTAVANANNAFQAVTGSSDTANLDAAQATASTAGDAYNAASITLSSDRAALQQGVNSVTQWAATFNTSQIYPGYQALRDAGTRVGQIGLALADLRDIAADSASRSNGADRSDITGRFSDLVTQISDLVNNAGGGFDNLLAGGNRAYELLNGVYLQARGRDLNTSIVNVLNGADISTAAGAQAVLDALTASDADGALEQANREIAIDSAPIGLAAGSLDPRAAVDSRYRALTDELPGIVAGAASDKQNLLDSNQSSVDIKVQTSGHTITINPQTGFDAGVTQIINAGAALLPSDPTDASGALAKIDEALFNANRALSFINGDIRALNIERGVAQAVISAANQTATTAQPFKATDFAIQFIKKYLIKKDMEANSQNFTMSSLITPLGNSPMSGLLSSISSLNGRSLNVLA